MSSTALALLTLLTTTALAQDHKLYNTAKQKLAAGKPITGVTISSPDPNIYCALANAGYDYVWIEMQHSPLTYGDVARMIWACRGSQAVPFVRVPDATESDIQKATDIGALGIIVPTVDTVEKAEAAVKWSKYPPQGRRSQGQGQYGALYGSDYHQTINENMLVVIMIETPIGVDNAEKIASVPGIDALTIGPTDLAQDLGVLGTPAQKEALRKYRVRLAEAARKHGKAVSMAIDSVEGVREMIALGATIVNYSSDTAVLRSGFASAIEEIRRPAAAHTR